MAITRLTDIITVFDSKWTYGDVKFGYEGEVNQDHDTKYPLMLVEPPSSIIPKIYDGREEYEFEINFYNLYSQDAQSVVTLQKRWDNLQDLANEWLDMVLKYYQDSVFTTNVEAYLNDESIEIERVKEVANDRLVQIKLTFTMSGFTKCFRPVSNYPTDYDGCLLWLKADSGVDFSIPSKKVSAWDDQSGNNNDFSVSLTSKQPYRYGYDGANDKAYINFKDDKKIQSDSFATLGSDFTIFTVAKSTVDLLRPYFSYHTVREKFVIGGRNGNTYVELEDDDGNTWNGGGSGSTTNYSIIRADLDGSTGDVNVQRNNDSITSATIASWSGVDFNETNYIIGNYNTDYLDDGNVEEVIVFNRVLTDNEIKDIKGYLNTKYKIY